MAYIVGNIDPWFRCLVRREFTCDFLRHHNAYLKAIAHMIRCEPGKSVWFEVSLLDPCGGALFRVPIQALVDRPCPLPEDMTYVQPWDCASDRFAVTEMAFLKRSGVEVLPARIKGQYITSVAFTGSGLADDSAQSKTLHICRLENGLIGAFPNNRVLWHDPAFWDVMTERPDFESLHYEARAEGFQHLFGRPHAEDGAIPPQPDCAKIALSTGY